MHGQKFLIAGLRGFMPLLANDDYKAPPPIPVVRDESEMVRKLQAELAAVERGEATCCLLFVRIEGVAGGVTDAVAKAVGERYSRSLRPYDGLFDVGNERYIISLPHIKVEDTVNVMERLRGAVCDEPLQVPGAGEVSVSVSIGGAMMDGELALDSNVERANKALMVTQRAGSPPVCLWSRDLEVG